MTVRIVNAETYIVGRQFVEITTGDQVVLARTDIGNAERGIFHKLALERHVELLNVRTLEIKRNGIGGERTKISGVSNTDCPAGKRSNATWVNAARQAQCASLSYALIEGICGKCIAHALRRRRRIVNSITPSQYILIAKAPRHS